MKFSLVIVAPNEVLSSDTEMQDYLDCCITLLPGTDFTYERVTCAHLLGGVPFCRVSDRDMRPLVPRVGQMARALYTRYALTVGGLKPPQSTLRELSYWLDTGVISNRFYEEQWLEYHTSDWYRAVGKNMSLWVDSQPDMLRDLMVTLDFTDPADFFDAKYQSRTDFERKILDRIGVPDAFVIGRPGDEGDDYIDRWQFTKMTTRDHMVSPVSEWCSFVHDNFMLLDLDSWMYVVSVEVKTGVRSL